MPSPRLGTRRLARPSAPSRAAQRRARELLGELFPAPDEAPASSAWRRAASVLVGAAALALGTAAMLARFAGSPPWRSLYAEDLGIYLPGALAHPWQLVASYAGYLQLVPRLIAQIVALLPVRDAAAGFAAAGALVASGCGLFAYNASAGHVRSRFLRALAGLSVVLLPVAQLEIADNGVNTPWYLLAALFWAILWRPPTRAGAWAAGVVAFLAAASSSLALIFVPLVAIRAVVVPRRIREQAVTIGWAAGSLLQVLVIATSHLSRGGNILKAGLYYPLEVILPALGWHLAGELRSAVGRVGGALLVGGFLIVVLWLAAVTQGTRCRVFIVTAVATGLVFTLIGAGLGWGAWNKPVTPAAEQGARYSTVPILLLDAALIVAADSAAAGSAAAGSAATGSAARPWRGRRPAVAAVVAVTALLAAGWVWDFRYPVNRTADWPVWSQTADSWQQHCQRSPAGSITVTFPRYWGPEPRRPISTTFSCASLRR